MKRVKDEEGHEHVELTSEEARGASLGRPVLYVLIGLLIGTILGVGVIYMAY